MRFLKLRTDHNRTRRDGSRYVTPLIVDAPRKFAPSGSRTETSLKRTRCQLITGAHDSGKSRWLARLRDSRSEIWGRKPQPVLLEGLMPLSSWVEVKGIERWYAEFTAGEDNPTPWQRLNLQQKADLLADYLLDTQALLFVDDAHRLTGRKAQVARRCMMSAKLWLVAASEEGRLPPSIRPIIERRDPQRTNLEIEREFIRMRTKEALAARKAAGHQLGRPKGPAKTLKLDAKRDQIEKYLGMGLGIRATAKLVDAAPSTLSDYVKRRGL